MADRKMTAQMEFELVGKDKLSKTFATAQKRAASFSDKLRTTLIASLKYAAVAAAAAAAAIGVALTVAFVKGVKEAAKFETEMDKIRGLVGANAEQMALYEDAILDAGAAFGTNAHAAAEAMYFITGVGFKGKLAVDVLNTTLKATATGLGDAADVAKALTRVISVYGKKNITAAKSADILTAAVNYGNMEADELAQNVGKVIPMAKQLGVSWEEVAGLMAASSLVLDVDEAAVSLNAFWTALIKPSAEGKKALEDVGLSYAELRQTVEDRGTLDAMRQLEDAFGGNVDEMVKVIGNVRAMRGLFTMLGMDAKQVDDILAKVEDSTGSLDRAWGKVSEGTGVKFKQVTEGLRSVMIKLGSAALPAVKLILDEITTVWLPKFSNWVSTHKEEIKQAFLDIAEAIVKFAQDAYAWWSNNKTEIEANVAAIGDLIKKMAKLQAWLSENGAGIAEYYRIMFYPITSAVAGLRTVLGLIDSVKSALGGGGGGAATDLSGAYDPLSWLPSGSSTSDDGPATGGITTGPLSGYEATLHGTEMVIPLNGNKFDPHLYDYGGGSGQTIVQVFIGDEQIEPKVTKLQRVRARRLARGFA